MSNKLRTWVASPAEAKVAWIVASIAIALVIGTFLWPLTDADHSDKTTVSKQIAISEAETGEPESIGKVIAKVQQESRQPEKPSPAVAKKVTPVAAKKVSTDKTLNRLSKGHYVQVGAFKQRKKAEALQKKLTAKWQPHLKEKSNKMIAVWIGPYKSVEAARAAKTDIAKQTKIKGFIVKN